MLREYINRYIVKLHDREIAILNDVESAIRYVHQYYDFNYATMRKTLKSSDVFKINNIKVYKTSYKSPYLTKNVNKAMKSLDKLPEVNLPMWVKGYRLNKIMQGKTMISRWYRKES